MDCKFVLRHLCHLAGNSEDILRCSWLSVCMNKRLLLIEIDLFSLSEMPSFKEQLYSNELFFKAPEPETKDKREEEWLNTTNFDLNGRNLYILCSFV